MASKPAHKGRLCSVNQGVPQDSPDFELAKVADVVGIGIGGHKLDPASFGITSVSTHVTQNHHFARRRAHMASDTLSIHVKTPAHSHPLSVDEAPSRGRRSRGAHDADSSPRPPTNYFTLKAQLEQDSREVKANLDGSAWGYSQAERRKSTESNSNHRLSSASLAAMWDSKPPAKSGPLFVIGAPPEFTLTPPRTPSRRVPELFFTDHESSEFSPTLASQVLATNWHDYSDEAIQSTISKIGASESPSETPIQPYHLALRVLSSALHNLSRVRMELEANRILLLEKETARRARAEALMSELQPSEQDIARRVIQSIFTDDDECQHQVSRQQSSMVSYFPSLHFECNL